MKEKVYECFSAMDFFWPHELLNRLPRRLLKSDALPTLFAHNLAKELQKPRTSLLREETAAKWQLCEFF